MCEIWNNNNQGKGEEITLEQTTGIIDELYQMGVPAINLFGGEVLLRKDIMEVIEEIKKRNIFCDLTTNGTIITERIASGLVKHKVDHLVISIDAPDEMHDRIRRISGSLEKIKETIALINLFKKSSNSKFPQITVNTTVSNLNLDLLDKMVPFAEDLQTDNLCFTYVYEAKKEIIRRTDETFGDKITADDIFASENSSLLIKTNEQISLLKQKIHQIKSLSKKTKVRARLGVGFYLNDKSHREGMFPINKCYVIHNRIMIDPFGNVFACTPLKNYIFGNVKDAGLSDIWHSEKAQYLRNKVNENMLPICQYCGCHFDRNIPALKFIRWFMNETR